jgi:GNAT superfamily N-acetyltransferase
MGLKLVDCGRKYWDFVMELRNSLREGFVHQETISIEDHYEYMEAYHKYYYIAIETAPNRFHDDIPVGFVGEINGDIRVATHPHHQKKGVGKFLINELMVRHPDAFAKVKLDNEASIKLFESCGFKRKFYILER